MCMCVHMCVHACVPACMYVTIFENAHSYLKGLVPTKRTMLLLTIKTFTLSLVAIRTLLELYQLYSQKVIGYLRSWGNWIELSQCISITIFLFDLSHKNCFCSSKQEWEAGIVSLALTWVVLLVWLQTMHWIGLYVTIMVKIIFSFVKVAGFGLLLIVAFGLSFYMLFYRPPKDNVSLNFYSYFTLIKKKFFLHNIIQ